MEYDVCTDERVSSHVLVTCSVLQMFADFCRSPFAIEQGWLVSKGLAPYLQLLAVINLKDLVSKEARLHVTLDP